VNRRDFITLLGGAVAARGALTASEGPASRLDLGWTFSGHFTRAGGFRQGLRDFDYVEGKNIIVEYRFAEGRSDRIADLVAELMQIGPDVASTLRGGSPWRAKNKTDGAGESFCKVPLWPGRLSFSV
jgi:putative ABC transport system substrate-binding protein